MKQLIALTLTVLLLLCAACSGERNANNEEQSSDKNISADLAEEADNAQKTYPISSESKYYSAAAELPDIVFSTAGSENKLIGNVYTFHGKVTGFDEMGMGDNSPAIKGFFVETEGGPVIVQDFMGYLSEISTVSYVEMCGDDNTDYTFPELDENAEFVCLYTGFSGKYDMPIFYYGCDEALVEDILLDFQNQQAEEEKDTTANEIEPAAETIKKESEEPDADNDESSLTDGQKEALDSANDYLSFMSFSHAGLIEQLEYEGFSTEDATYAADNCGADWNEQAVLEAKQYTDIMGFSYLGLIDQLEFEGFTAEQATYGADHCGADWNEQALKSAESYLSIFDYSRAELIDQLEYEEFTYEQASYAADQLGL